MKEICKGGNKSGWYGHMNMLIEKGKEANDSKVQLMNEEGERIADEKKIKDIIENSWGDPFLLERECITHKNMNLVHQFCHYQYNIFFIIIMIYRINIMTFQLNKNIKVF